LFIGKQYLAIFGYFKKSPSRLPVTIFETLFWLGVLARIKTNYKHQKSHLSLLCGENVWAKNAFFQNLNKYDFSVFTPKLLPKAFWSVPFERRRKILKKFIFLIKALSSFCGISVNTLNYDDFFPLYFYSKNDSIL